MRKQIITLLLICSLAIYANAGADLACNAACGTGAVGTACEDSTPASDAANGPDTHCKTCANTATHKVLMTASTGTYGTCTPIATGCSTSTDAKVFKTGQTSGSEVLYYCWTPAADNAKLACASVYNTIASHFYATTDAYLNDCITCASTNKVLLASSTATGGYCTAAATGCSTATDAKVYKSGQTAGSEVLYYCWTPVANGDKLLCATIAGTIATDFYTSTDDYLQDCRTCSTPTTNKVLLASSTATEGYCTASSVGCGTAGDVKVWKSGQTSGSEVFYYCWTPAANGAKLLCSSVSNTIASHFYADTDSYLIDCTSCSSTNRVLLAASTDSAGYCTAASTGCTTATDAKVYKSGQTAGSEQLYYCWTPAASGTKLLCATRSQTIGTYFYASTDDFLKDCLTCSTPATEKVEMDSLTGTTGYCKATSTACAAPSGSLPGVKIWKSGQTSGSEVFYACIKTSDQSGQSKLCTTYTQTAATYFYADVATALADCTSCASSGQTLIVADTSAVKGSCVLTTAPCSANTKYVSRFPAATTWGSAITAFCDYGISGSHNFKCGACADKATGASATRCATLAFAATDFSFTADPSDRCATCTTPADIIKLPATAGTYGSCNAAIGDISCDANYFKRYDMNPASNGLAHCGTASQASTTCVVCILSSKCATFAYKNGFVSTATAIDAFPATDSDVTDRCLTCIASTTEFPAVSAATDIAGTCTAFSTCTSTQQAIKQAVTTLGKCTTVVLDGTNAAYKQVCLTFVTQTAVLTNAEALDKCATCTASTQIFSSSTAATAPGNCVLQADIQSHCGNGKFMLATALTNGVCTTATAATVSVITGDTTTSQPCQTFRYATGVFYYTTNDLALAQCLTCQTTSYSVIGAASNSVSGNCKAISSIQTICGDYKYLKQATGDVNFCYDSKDTLETITGASPTKYLNCKTYFYDSSNIRYANNEAAFQKCLTCAGRKLYVTATSGADYGKCFDNPWSPVAACAVNQYVFATGASAFVGYCADGVDTVGSSGQKKCKTYFYGENTLFPTTVSTFNDNCYECDAGHVLLRVAGEKRGKCYDTTANAATACGGLGWFLRKGTGDADFGTGLVFSYCEQSDIPTNSYQKQCKTFFYDTNTWLDKTPAQANNWCRSCDTDQLLLEAAAGDGYGKCISQVAGACTTGYFIMKESDTAGQLTGICTQVTATSPQVVCASFYYNNLLYIDDTAASVRNKCISCGSTQLLAVTASNDPFGKCYSNINTAWALAGTGKFFKKINHLATQFTSATIVQAYTSSQCNTFLYSNSNGFYKDVFEAESDCNACGTGAIKIEGVFKSCLRSVKCSTFEGTTYDNLETAETKCTACNAGFALIAASGTVGVCTPSDSCLTFLDATSTSIDVANTKCLSCKSGYFYVKAELTSTSGTCVTSTSCLASTSTTSGLAITAFEQDCTTCNVGYYRIAKDTDKLNCVAFTTGDCLRATDEVHATEAAAIAKCVQCKSGFFPKGTGSGTCTAFTKKTDCVKFAPGATTTEDLFLTTKCAQCPSEFFYLDGGNCLPCPDPCRTCKSTKYVDVDDGNANGFCTSCFEGYGDLVLYTNQMHGICRACHTSCGSCSGIYFNTAPEANSRKCESCTYPKYFAYEIMTESGTCSACDSRQSNCLVCSGAGICIQCQSGYFQTMNETMGCRACRVSGCAVCVDEGQTCLKYACSAGCQECSSSTVCTTCQPGYYKNGDACSSCDPSCSECTATGTAGCTVKKPNYQGSCITNCLECSPADTAAASCTTPFWGYFKFSVTNTADPPVTTTTIESCVPGCKTCSSHAFADCTECISGFYKWDAGFVCDRCHKSCAKCDGPTLKQCNYCFPGNYLQVLLQGEMDGFCNVCDPNHCKTCGGRAPAPPLACTSCYGSKVIDLLFEGFGIKNGPCIDSCPEGKFNDGGFCRNCKLGSPSPCPQPPAAVSASYLAFPLILIALIIMML